MIGARHAAEAERVGLLKPAYLRCEYRVDPLGLDVAKPRLSWIVTSDDRAQVQTAYHVRVASSQEVLAGGQGDLWDSGEVESDETSAIVYDGQLLSSHRRCVWSVRVWDRDGRPSGWSAPASWSMGPLCAEDWTAEWIGHDSARAGLTFPDTAAAVVGAHGDQPRGRPQLAELVLPAPAFLRTSFRVEKPVKRATVYATALGLVDVHLNGSRVHGDYFNPGWTDYTRRVLYRAYDVTDRLSPGENALGAILADGWYSGYVGYGGQRDHYGTNPRARVQLHIEYEDGTTADLGTGPGWKARTGPIRAADFLMGEVYDARRELAGWDAPGFDDGEWYPVEVGAEVDPAVEWHPAQPVEEIAVFEPRSINEPAPGTYVLDLGQNFAGVPRLTVQGRPGQEISLRFAERLNPDGTIYTANLRTARATDTYICKGGEPETWQPRFTYHGFQYIEVTGLDAPPARAAVVGVAMSSATPVVGHFECSDPMLEQLHSNIYWTQRANFLEIPTDCPQRDERLGWTGDAQVYGRPATLNCDVHAFFIKWLQDLIDGQGADGQFPTVAPVKVAANRGSPAWEDAGVIVPWIIYETYGDRRLLERQYPSMVRFLEFRRARSKDGVLPPDGYYGFGDWLNIDADTSKDVIYTAYHAHSTELTAKAALVLGKDEDATRFHELHQRIKEAFNSQYVDENGRIQGDTQTAYVLALAFDLLDGAVRSKAAEHLVARIEDRGGHLSTGFIGTKDLMVVLSKIGREDVAYRLLQNETFPSWVFSIRQGATSIWERWDGWTPEKGFQTPGMNSFSHYSFGAVYQWIVENIGGIRSAGSSYKRIVIAPHPGGSLTSAHVGYISIHGGVRSRWSREGDSHALEVAIPANTTATVKLLAACPGDVTEGGKPLEEAEGIRVVGTEGGRVVLEVGSGTYQFVVEGR
jgi:alpha-L-rhamnosidase